MTVKELIEVLLKQNPAPQVHIRYLDINAYGCIEGDDYICSDDVDIYANKQNEVIIDIREAQQGY